MVSAIIIDDERKLRISLKGKIEEYCPDVRVVAEADGVKSGIKSVLENKPDIIFLDIQLTDGTGFDLLKHFSEGESKELFRFKVIFTTAHNQFAIKAFKFSAVDYLLKPIDPDELVSAVEKVKSIKEEMEIANYELLLENVKHAMDLPKKIALSTAERIHICNISDISRCMSDDNYTKFYVKEDKPIMVSKTLKEFEGLLKDYGFERVHQSHLINMNYVKTYEKVHGGYIIMKDGSEVPVSQRQRERVVNYFKSL